MHTYDLDVEGYHTPLTATEIAELFHAGHLQSHDRCRLVGTTVWKTIQELFPVLKREPTTATWSPSEEANEIATAAQPITSALKAGWICVGLGLAISWFFPFGNVFFSIAIVSAIVAMCTHQVNRGLILLLSAFGGLALSVLIFFLLVAGTVGAIGMGAVNASAKRVQARQSRMETQSAGAHQLRPSINNAQVPRAYGIDPLQQASAVSNRSDATTRRQVAIQQTNEALRQAEFDRARERSALQQTEQQRDRINARQAELARVEKSIDWWDNLIRDAKSRGSNTAFFEEQRDKLIQRRSELQF